MSNLPTIPPEVLKTLWRINPATMAVALTKDDPLPWLLASHLRMLSEWIVSAVNGVRPRIIINMPPRHGKSELISKWTPVWYLQNFPHKTVIDVGYSVTFAEEWGRKVRNLISEHRDRLNFSLSADSKAAGRWNTTVGGGMYSTGIDGQITGRGADLFIIDDPHKDSAEANSLLKRDTVWKWWTETARSRVMPGGSVILVMTRWHDDDFAGRLLKASANGTGEHWDVLNLPALAMEGDVLGRAPGEPLWPALRPLDYLQALMQGMSEEAWAAQFQGTPANIVRAGNVYKGFNSARNVRPLAFDPRRPLVWSMDFNVDPMCSVLAQWHEETTPTTFLTNEKRQHINVLGEICLPNSSTQEMCEEFINRTEQYRKEAGGRLLHVRIYGDRSGQSRKTVGPSDYEAVKQFFAHQPGYRVTMHLTNSNPAVRDRVNAVNAMCCNALGEVRTHFDPSCIELVKDMLQVQWKRDSGGNTTGQIDKSDMARTHVSDAYGYFVQKEFGITSRAGVRPGIAQ